MSPQRHPDTDKVYAALLQIPMFRAQAEVIKTGGGDPRESISQGLIDMEVILADLGQAYHTKHPGETEAPYKVFLTYNVDTRAHDIVPKVGNRAILEAQNTAVAEIMKGQLSLKLVKHGD